MQFLAQQHLAAAKKLRANGWRLFGSRPRNIRQKKANSFVVCARLASVPFPSAFLKFGLS